MLRRKHGAGRPRVNEGADKKDGDSVQGHRFFQSLESEDAEIAEAHAKQEAEQAPRAGGWGSWKCLRLPFLAEHECAQIHSSAWSTSIANLRC